MDEYYFRGTSTLRTSTKQSFEGFSNALCVDPSAVDDFKAALDRALTEQMQKLALKQQKAEREEVCFDTFNKQNIFYNGK